MASSARNKGRVALKPPEAAAAPPATRATAAGTGIPSASARTMKNTNRYPWCPINESNGFIRELGSGCASIKKKGGLCRPLGAPVQEPLLRHVAHLLCLEHLHAHDANLALVGIHVRPQYNMLTLSSMYAFGFD